jgi:hypothetical protein
MRFSLIRMSENEHWLVRVCHHIIWDDWSSRVMRKELALLYEAKRDGKSPPLPEFEPLQYADYAAWQLKTFRRGGPAYQKAVVWWKDCFQQPPRSIDLPFVRAAPLVGVDPSEGRIKWPVDVEVAQRLARFARNESTTIFVVWLAALVALLKTETRQSDVVIGTYITARRRAEVQNMMGFFANQLALRFQCTTAMPFRNWLSEVASRVHAAEKHCEIPYAELLGELHTLGTTLAVPLVFTAPLDFGLGDLHFAGLKLTRQQFNVPGPMPWYCNVQLTEYDNLQECRAVFDARIYDPTGVRRFIGRLCDFVDAASWHPDLSIDELLAFSEPGYQAQQSKSQIARENLRA